MPKRDLDHSHASSLSTSDSGAATISLSVKDIEIPETENRSVPLTFSPALVTVHSGAMSGSGLGVVLVIDDEEIVRLLAKRTLEFHGCDVLVAANGVEGLRLYSENSEVGLVLLDLMMPGLSGEATLEGLRSVRGETPVIIMSGLEEGRISEELHGLEIFAILTKPFRPAGLAELVKRALGN